MILDTTSEDWLVGQAFPAQMVNALDSENVHACNTESFGPNATRARGSRATSCRSSLYGGAQSPTPVVGRMARRREGGRECVRFGQEKGLVLYLALLDTSGSAKWRAKPIAGLQRRSPDGYPASLEVATRACLMGTDKKCPVGNPPRATEDSRAPPVCSYRRSVNSGSPPISRPATFPRKWRFSRGHVCGCDAAS